MIEARSAKTMTMGEGGLALAMALAAFMCIFAAAKAQDAPFAFHAYLGAAAAVASVFWGLAGFLVGLWLALELAWPALNFDLPWINFGRLRPLHTSAVIFAFGGNVLIATSFYVVQRTCRTRIAGELAPWFVVLGYNFFILIAGTGYLLGVTQSKEYAEPEWYADLWLTVVWVVYLLVF